MYTISPQIGPLSDSSTPGQGVTGNNRELKVIFSGIFSDSRQYTICIFVRYEKLSKIACFVQSLKGQGLSCIWPMLKRITHNQKVHTSTVFSPLAEFQFIFFILNSEIKWNISVSSFMSDAIMLTCFPAAIRKKATFMGYCWEGPTPPAISRT